MTVDFVWICGVFFWQEICAKSFKYTYTNCKERRKNLTWFILTDFFHYYLPSQSPSLRASAKVATDTNEMKMTNFIVELFEVSVINDNSKRFFLIIRQFFRRLP